MTRDEEIDNCKTVSDFCKNMEIFNGTKMTEYAARGIEVTSLASIAVSLKRIADVLEKSEIINTDNLRQTGK